MKLADRCRQWPKTARRIIALSLVPAVMICVWCAAILPMLTLHEAQSEWRVDAQALLDAARDTAAWGPTLERNIAAMRASALWGKLYRSDRAGASAITMQSELSELLAQSQINVQSMTPIPSSALGPLMRNGARVSTSMRIDQLKSFLTALAQHRHYLRVDQLSVTASQAQPAAANPPLAVSMEIYGFELGKSSGDGITSTAAMRRPNESL